MKSRDFTLELITPAFLAGAGTGDASTTLDHKGKKPQVYPIRPDGDGLRVPALRGILRFWYRALRADRDHRALFSGEASVFGSASRGQGLRLIPTGGTPWRSIPITGPAGSAQAYLGYGAVHFVGDGRSSSQNKFAFREAAPVGARFSFRALGTPEQIAVLDRCLLLLHLFGGVGSRSRRGWGSLQVSSPEVEIAPPPAGAEPAAWFAEQVSRLWPSPAPPPSGIDPARFSAFNRASKVSITKPIDGSYEDVFRHFYQQFRHARLWSGRGPISVEDHDRETRAVDGWAGPLQELPQRLAYGLPYAPAAKDRSWTVRYVPMPRSPTNRPHPPSAPEGRRASPLLLKVLRLEPDRHLGVALLLGGHFFGNPDQEIGAVVARPRDRESTGKTGTLPPPDYSAIEAFLGHPDWTPIPIP